jgi:hypothetical protein
MKNDVMREFKRYEGIKTHIWEYMKVNLTHNEGIKTLNNVVRHLKLEEDHIEASKSQETETTVHLIGSISHGGQSQKRKSNDGKGKGKQDKKYKGSIVARKDFSEQV